MVDVATALAGAVGDVVFRPMSADDLPFVNEMERLMMATPFNGYARELENPQAMYYVLTCEGSVFAFAGYWLIVDELHLSIIAVHPAWQGQGWGGLLLVGMLLEAGKSADLLLATLEVRESNTTAQHLYQQLGFVLVGQRKRYYQDNGETALLLTVEPFDEAYLAFLQGEWVRRLRLIAGRRVGFVGGEAG